MNGIRIRLAAIVLGCCIVQGLAGNPRRRRPRRPPHKRSASRRSNRTSPIAKPTKEETAASTIRAEKQGNATAWVVRNGGGETLRRFADTNGDNVVDLWCYYNDGLESIATSTPISTARPTSIAGSKPAARAGASTRTKTAASTPGK